MIRTGLRELAPDLVGLQEVLRFGLHGPWNRDNDQAAELADGTAYTSVFAAGGDLGGTLCLGNALLSRYPVRHSEVFNLPSDGSDLARSLLYALVETPERTTPVFVTHLSWRFDESALRQRQVQAILERVGQVSEPRSWPAILMGDFNAEPETDEIRLLTGQAPAPLHVVFSDAWSAGSGPGYTFDPRNHFAAESKEPARRIDYIFVEQRAAAPTQPFERTQLVFDEPEVDAAGRVVWASDHFGLVTDIHH